MEKNNNFSLLKKDSTVNSRFKKLHFYFLKSRVVWFKKDLWYESKNRLSEKNALCRWICKLRSFLNREFTVLNVSQNCHFLNPPTCSFADVIKGWCLFESHSKCDHRRIMPKAFFFIAPMILNNNYFSILIVWLHFLTIK